MIRDLGLSMHIHNQTGMTCATQCIIIAVMTQSVRYERTEEVEASKMHQEEEKRREKKG